MFIIFIYYHMIIIGAGISGLSLAYFLQSNNIDVIVLERDEKFDSDRQGFSLTMQAGTKMIFEQYNLLDEITKYGHRAEKQVFYNNESVLYKNDNNDVDRFNYPLPRQELRNIFYSKLKPNTVIWNTKVIDVINNNNINIITTNGNYTTDIVIVCDGINSIIRKKYIPNIQLNDLGLCNVYGISDLTKTSTETCDKFNATEVQVLDGKHRLFSKPFDKTRQMWELTWPVDEQFSKLYKLQKNGTDIRKESLDQCKKIIKLWNISWINDFFSVTKSEDIIVHPLFDLDPSTLNFSSVPKNIIFIGDTVHPMAPYVGMGANEALMDSYLLSEMFIENKVSNINMLSNVDMFYKEMINRTSRTVLLSRANTKFYHSIDSINKEKLWTFKQWKMNKTM